MAGKFAYRSIFLALLVLISSTGMYVDAHFCQGKIKAVAIFKKAPGCKGMQENNSLSCSSKNQKSQGALNKKNCCKNNGLFAKQSVETEKSKSFTINQFARALGTDFYGFISILGNGLLFNNDFHERRIHPPPILNKEINFQVLFQVFRN